MSISPQSRKIIITTSWDDGHPLDFRIADLLAKHGLRGTFYVPLENSRPCLSPAQIRELSQTFEIGAHTVHHCVLTSVAEDKARAEIVQSKARLEQITGKPCSVFCFPKGRFSSGHVAMVGEAGFCGTRTVELLSFKQPDFKHGLAVIPTTIQACPNPLSTYLRNSVKRLRYNALWTLLSCHRSTDWASFALGLLRRVERTGGIFHLWGHSWEIEQYRQWEPLDRVFAAMSQVRGAFVANSELCINGQ